MTGVGVSLPLPSTTVPSGRVVALLIIHLHFACGVEWGAELPPIWEEVARMKGRTEGLTTLNQTLLMGIPSCRRFFGGRAYFIASLPLLMFVKNMSLMNYSLDPACSGRGSSLG